jgi:hypothetical protein
MNSHILAIIEKVRKKINIEGTNLDIKREWWNLKSDLNEFIKDIAAMANNHNGDSSIIIGLDNKGNVYNSPLPYDEAIIQNKHKDKIHPKINIKITEYKFENKIISVIEIPHSDNRPHVILKQGSSENFIPIRIGSSTLTASRNDLNVMFEERLKLAQPNLDISLVEENISWANYAAYKGPCFFVKVKLDNFEGQSPEFITSVTMIERSGEHWQSKYFQFKEKKINSHLKIDSKDIVDSIELYISDKAPTTPNTSRVRPDLDLDSIYLRFECRNGKMIKIPLKPSWFK